MTSRVVHARIPDKIIVGCKDILESSDISTENRPISSIVSIAITAMINGALREGTIPARSAEEVARMLGTAGNPVVAAPPLVSADDVAEADGLHDDAFQAAINDAVAAVVTPDAKLDDAEIFTGAEHTKAEPKVIPITVENRIPFNEIKTISPLDRFVQAADGNALLQEALEIVYANVNPVNWGNSACETMIQQVVKLLEAQKSGQ